MATSSTKTTSPQDPFRLLKAILIGLALGFIAVMLVPYLMPAREQQLPRVAANQRRIPVKTPPAAGRRPQDSESSRLETKGPEPAKIAPDALANAKAKEETPDGGQSPQDGKARPETGDGLPPAPLAPEAAKDIPKAEPVLVPAIRVTFPKPFSDEDMTAALQPLLSFKISDDDASAVKEVISAASKGNDEAARAAIQKIADPAAKTFSEWRRLRAPNASFEDVIAFWNAHPLFPGPAQDASIERNLFLSTASSADILKFYTNRTPLTAAGKASLGAALMDSGEKQRGLSLIKFVWTRYPLDPAVQERFTSRFGALLDGEDQSRRQLLLTIRTRQQADSAKADAEEKGLRAAARLRARKSGSLHGGRHGKGSKRKGRRHGEARYPLLQRNAAAAGKASSFPAVSMSILVKLKKTEEKTGDSENTNAGTGKPESSQPKADGQDVKPAVEDGKAAKPDQQDGKAAAKPAETKGAKSEDKTAQSKAAENALKLAKERAAGPAMLLARLKSLRREKSDDDVWSLLRSIDPDAADLADPERWWEFRRNEIRRALDSDHPKTAYGIAKAHGPLDDDSRSEAEFLAGWIALRFLDDPKRAQPHFEAARSVKGSVRDETRATYWLARAKLGQGLPKEAEALFSEASDHFYNYYGSLARQALRKGGPCEFRAPPRPGQEAVTAFVNEDAFKAVMIAKQLDLQPALIAFILDLARQVRDPEQMTLLLELAERVAPPHVAIRAAKIGLIRGFATEAYAFPTLLPKFDPAGGNVKIEPALLHALTRQESEFHTGSVSPVGARGLMQLMPQTAKLVAGANKIKYDLPRLVSDPSYNVTLGSAFLAQLVSGYDGSYVLALAAYNAGPGRVTQWIKDFGDPRDKAIDPVDWVERIPFNETRNYVQRILESTQLYRCRFETGKAKLQIVEDLHRGRPGKVPDLADVTGSAELDQTP